MSTFSDQKVLSVHHWTDRLFTFTTTRDPALRFSNGHFTMIGLRIDGRPRVRAYSIVSPNHEDYLEFLSIKVEDGPLTNMGLLTDLRRIRKRRRAGPAHRAPRDRARARRDRLTRPLPVWRRPMPTADRRRRAVFVRTPAGSPRRTAG